MFNAEKYHSGTPLLRPTLGHENRVTDPFTFTFSPKSDQFEISPTASPEILQYITQYEELAFHKLIQMKDDYATNSHYLTHSFPLKGWENVLFELGSERVRREEKSSRNNRVTVITGVTVRCGSTVFEVAVQRLKCIPSSTL